MMPGPTSAEPAGATLNCRGACTFGREADVKRIPIAVATALVVTRVGHLRGPGSQSGLRRVPGYPSEPP
jgi:hypothetical protein